MTLLGAYADWHRLQVETGDLDPVYPVYRGLSEAWELTQEQAAWLCVLHVAYYHAGSALSVFYEYPDPSDLPLPIPDTLLHLSCATERRGHRDPRKLSAHLTAAREALGPGALDWLTAYGTEWGPLNRRIAELHGNGRWAAYKLAEMLWKVADVPTRATDAGHANSSGPRKGLGLLFPGLPQGNGPDALAQLDYLTEELGVMLGEDDIAQVETSLCDFHSLTRGGYYLGHDIDVMLDQLTSRPHHAATRDALAVRAAVFSPELLGELGGWGGVRAPLRGLYTRTGELDWRNLS